MVVGGWWLKYFLCFWRLVASSGLFKLSVSPLPFKRSIYRLERSSATPISDPPKFRLFTSLRTTEPPKFSAHFPLFGRFRAERSRTSPQTLTFQYRTPRSRLVIPSPRSFSAENTFLTQLFGEFQGAVFPVPKISLDIRTFAILKVLISSEVLY